MESAVPSPRVVLILKADQLYAETLRQFTLREFPQARVLLAASVGAATQLMSKQAVDLFVSGLVAGMEGDVLDLLLRCVRRSDGPRHVLVVTAQPEDHVLVALRRLAVSGVFNPATEPPDAFLSALRAVAAGSRYWSQSIVDELQRIRAGSKGVFRLLTAFEQVVLSVVGDGSDNDAAAEMLGLSPATVSTVRRELHRKLGVQHRGDLIRVAVQTGFVHFTPTGVMRPGFTLLSSAYHPRRTPEPAKPTRTELVERIDEASADIAAIKHISENQ